MKQFVKDFIKVTLGWLAVDAVLLSIWAMVLTIKYLVL